MDRRNVLLFGRRTCVVVATTLLVAGCGVAPDQRGGASLDLPPVRPTQVRGLGTCVNLQGDVGDGRSGERMPDVRLPCFNEERMVDLSRLRGPAVVNLWASWCGPCRKEMPLLATAARNHRDISFLGVNSQDNMTAAADLLERTGVGYPQVVDPEALLLATTRVPGLPVTLAVDSQGRIVDKVIGRVSEDELDRLLGALSAAARPIVVESGPRW